MSQAILEFVDSRGTALRVDDRAGVIRGVKILGLASRNGRRYLPAALEGAVALYEGAKVNVNHPKGAPNAPRDYQERIGVLRNVALRDADGAGGGADGAGHGGDAGRGGLFGDLHYNPRHALAEQLAWDARHAPENVGLSHNVLAVTARRGEETVVESIERVQSVDLVADPATTRGLFEQADAARSADAAGRAARAVWLAELSLDELRSARGDLVESILETAMSEIAELRADVDRLRAEKSIVERRARLKTLLAEFELPDPDLDGPGSRAIVSDEFLRAALAAADEAALRRIVEERAALVRTARNGAASGRSCRATCREQTQVDTLLACRDAASFVKAIRV